MKLETMRVRVFVAFLLLSVAGGVLAQDVDIEKYTNGQDADVAPGPVLIVGSPVTWTYVVTNTSGRDLTNITVTDDQGVTVTCPGTTLEAGLSFTCTATGTAVLGQYANIGTVNATMPNSAVVTDSDPSHYFGQAEPSIAIEKRTNGVDADSPPGPIVSVGSTVNWEYEITNIGTEALENIAVTDDQGVTVSCPGTTLAAGASMICTASGIATVGQYTNIGSVSATRSVSLDTTAATDVSHYFGQTLRLVKKTNGIDVSAAPGPVIPPGQTVTWTYEVTNPGPATVSALTVVDDQQGPASCPQTSIIAGETVICSINAPAIPGQYTNNATATATLPAGGGTVTATDQSFYLGASITIQKLTNGADANTPPGPPIAVGSPVSWTYVVTNQSSTDTFTNVLVADDQGVVVTCPLTSLTPGQSMTCTASGVAVAGQYANIGTVTADSSEGAISASDPSHYFGQTDILDYGDAPDPTYPTFFTNNGARHVFSTVFLGACVDSELDAFASAAADGDDTNAGASTNGTCATPGDDEDGVTFPAPLYRGQNASANVVASAPCTLSAFIDYAGDGDFSDAEDALFPGGSALAAGANTVNFTIPAGATAGTTFARFRCTTDGAVSYNGQASNGEVEDYSIEIAEPPPVIDATKASALQNDLNGDSQVGPGDTLRYTITITNSGFGDALDVVFTDTPDANTALVAGSVTTSNGTVTTGNTGGDTTVEVNVGTIASMNSAVITFDVTVDSPLAPGVTSVSNQGTVSGSNFASQSTDDAAQPGSEDPTQTTIVLTPEVTATKSDADLGNGTIEYTIVITNDGDSDATGVAFQDTPDANTDLVVGSVTTTAGTVTTGNTAGDTSVLVNVGSVAVGTSVTITFRVTLDDPFPTGVTSVSNQGTVSGSNFTTVSTDDPAAGGASDPTVTTIDPPTVTATKTDANLGGGTIEYTIVITNSGAGDALNVTFQDTPDPNTDLVVGSVTTTAGTVTTGNTPGDTSVAVNVGTIASGASVTITFRVTLDDPFPNGVTTVSNQGTVSGSNFATVSTDDPAAGGASDPTVTVITPASIPGVPTLSEAMLLALMAMLAVVALRKM
jgi:uncharacterized repeat protein (TIGR01451 family)